MYLHLILKVVSEVCLSPQISQDLELCIETELPNIKSLENSISKIVITIIKPIVIENALFQLPNLKSL